MNIVYISYSIIFVLFVLVYNKDIVFKKLKILISLITRAKDNPSIIRDVSLGLFTNGIFSAINATTIYGVFGYSFLTLFAMLGIINANNRKG